jgi:hypothetical protein
MLNKFPIYKWEIYLALSYSQTQQQSKQHHFLPFAIQQQLKQSQHFPARQKGLEQSNESVENYSNALWTMNHFICRKSCPCSKSRRYFSTLFTVQHCEFLALVLVPGQFPLPLAFSYPHP